MGKCIYKCLATSCNVKNYYSMPQGFKQLIDVEL